MSGDRRMKAEGFSNAACEFRIDFINELDSYFIKKYLGQDQQDYQDYFNVLPHFPEENEETQSDFVGRESLILISKLPYWIDVTPSC